MSSYNTISAIEESRGSRGRDRMVVGFTTTVDISPCPCDLTGNSCDVNCCCDLDCTSDDRNVFTGCLTSSGK
jgi:hypothetical protein